MTTQLEQELTEARNSYRFVMRLLWRKNTVRFFVAKQREEFLDELSGLVDEIDEILALIASAKGLVVQARASNAMFLSNGFRLQSYYATQFISPESAIAPASIMILRMIDEKFRLIGRRLKRYNQMLRLLLEKRESGFDRVWMDLAGIPVGDYFPDEVNLYLINEVYAGVMLAIDYPPDDPPPARRRAILDQLR